MSQMTATARAGVRSIAQRPSVPRLHVVSGAESRSGGVGFALFCVGLLVSGLVALLLLNTSMSQGSFTLYDLQSTSGELTDQTTSLRTQLRDQEAPANLARRAAAQGMVPSASSAFIRLSDGKVLGVAKAASGAQRFTVVTPAASGSTATATKAADSSAAAGMAAAVQTARQQATTVTGPTQRTSTKQQDTTTKR
ncbi:MAG TPA: hypothetical protein VFL99_16300 [Segeticoccus sp.]|uniref:hypothetical protein n=1 Tax=Segeticoccus sp. TaxID=2706531 RepID=UPI002D7FA36C|nr:hypothetical protein [Segeticoccus sp.]HET8601887.1 hypothetical protein [Segeticoccus sp.]